MVATVRNVLVITLDDAGVERDPVYAPDLYPVVPSSEYVDMPVLRRAYREGVRLRRPRAQAFCSPNRATRESGRWAFRTGVGGLVDQNDHGLLPDEVCIPSALKRGLAGEIDCALIGKLHLSERGQGWPGAALAMGYDVWLGAKDNLDPLRIGDHRQWTRNDVRSRKVAGRRPAASDTALYQWADERVAADAVDWIRGRHEAGRRWFCNVNFHAPHFPYQRPPAGTYDAVKYAQATNFSSDFKVTMVSLLQAVDTLIGRMLEELGDAMDGTMVIYTSDNGTPATVLPTQLQVAGSGSVYPPGSHSNGKGTMYDLGLVVPCVFFGAGVSGPGRVLNGPWSVVDIFATVGAALGADLTLSPGKGGVRDSVSWWPSISGTASAPRTFGLAEDYTGDGPNGPNAGAVTAGDRAAWDSRYKLVRPAEGLVFPNSTDEFYDIDTDPYELTNLTPSGSTASLTPAQLTAYNALVAWYQTTLATI